ncbi:MAG: sodium:solute symporter family protein [Candidatus Babeliales bacterium]
MALLFIVVLLILSSIYLFLGSLVSKDITSTTDYFLAGRQLGYISVTFTLIATQLGGGMMLGTAQKAYFYGFYGIVYTLGMSVGFLLLASGIAQRLQSFQVSTTAELFEKCYQSPLLKKIASLLSVMTLGGLLLAQFIASRTLLAGIGLNNEIVFLLFWAFIIGYTVLGGLKAVVITDIFQVIFIIIIFGGILIYYFFSYPSLFSWHTLAQQQTLFDTTNMNKSDIAATFLMPVFFALIEQDLAQRFFASRSKKIAFWSALSAAIFMILFSLVPIYFGMQTRVLNLSITNETNPLIPSLEYMTSTFVFVLAVCGIISAFTSTADSLLAATSTNIAEDLVKEYIPPKKRLLFAQIITCAIGVVILILSYFVPNDIIGTLIKSYELTVSCLFVPLMYSYYYTGLNKKPAALSMLTGFISFILVAYYQIPFGGLLAVFCSFISFVSYNRLLKVKLVLNN